MQRILIVEDIAETRDWLVALVAEAFEGAQIDTAALLGQARGMMGRGYDLALIDLGLPDGSGLDFLRQMRAASPATICVVTTVIGDDAIVVSALSAGAEGYLLKENPAGVLTRQLMQIGDGVPALSPSIARRIMQHFRYTGPSAGEEQQMTEREREVLSLIGRGLRNAEVARELGIAESTVAGYIKAVYRKLGISSRAEAAWHAARLGLHHGGEG
ncbi:LuxR C-terminal-related transcriptional regulator [Pseudooceanicola nanhaiensis]|uniref:LuxR C-terminal-related transcriptional regulator n=1 Tax=Pseudooceanicola nanhaiensis TaxID=375761 RepID=UPI001CD77B93|nr:response regulator transcription factor [Pseudooceanicola nanhaiensis]MCA0922059.1 response regulator transcription factor [Pseudooceanicola nanhaiensis]